jgi:predicted amino acid dehydrogenase
VLIRGESSREEENGMLLKDKNAVIYGAAGAIGSAVARTFAREGADVFLTGRTLAKLDAVAKEITVEGGRAHTAEVDALDLQSVNEHAATMSGGRKGSRRTGPPSPWPNGWERTPWCSPATTGASVPSTRRSPPRSTR